MQPINVTFDSNVWEEIVVNQEYPFVQIKNLIIENKINPHFCAFALSLESIQRQARLDFFERGHQPKMERLDTTVGNDGTIEQVIGISPDYSSYPESHPKLVDKALKAKDLGFTVLEMTNLGIPRRMDILNQIKHFHDEDDSKFLDYCEKLAECNEFITRINCGYCDYSLLKLRYNIGGLCKLSLTTENFSRKDLEDKVIKAIAEWSDGESLSAHYASGNDFFCSNDQGKSAGRTSIFYKENLKKLLDKFCIKVLTSDQLLDKISNLEELKNV